MLITAATGLLPRATIFVLPFSASLISPDTPMPEASETEMRALVSMTAMTADYMRHARGRRLLAHRSHHDSRRSMARIGGVAGRVVHPQDHDLSEGAGHVAAALLSAGSNQHPDVGADLGGRLRRRSGGGGPARSRDGVGVSLEG